MYQNLDLFEQLMNKLIYNKLQLPNTDLFLSKLLYWAEKKLLAI